MEIGQNHHPDDQEQNVNHQLDPLVHEHGPRWGLTFYNEDHRQIFKKLWDRAKITEHDRISESLNPPCHQHHPKRRASTRDKV